MSVNLDREVASRQGSGGQATQYRRLPGEGGRMCEKVGLTPAPCDALGAVSGVHYLMEEKTLQDMCVWNDLFMTLLSSIPLFI